LTPRGSEAQKCDKLDLESDIERRQEDFWIFERLSGTWLDFLVSTSHGAKGVVGSGLGTWNRRQPFETLLDLVGTVFGLVSASLEACLASCLDFARVPRFENLEL
jgi:hypothetical protein